MHVMYQEAWLERVLAGTGLVITPCWHEAWLHQQARTRLRVAYTNLIIDVYSISELNDVEDCCRTGSAPFPHPTAVPLLSLMLA